MKHARPKNLAASLGLLICASLLTLSAFGSGGVNDGGGHEFEAAFKAKTLKILGEISSYPESAKGLLKFDPDLVTAIASQPGAFAPLCAAGGTLEKIVAEGKMARVYKDSPNTVYLDCRDSRAAQWEALFKSDSPVDKVLFLHEVNRIAGIDGENDYLPSSSYLKAFTQRQAVIKKALGKLFTVGPRSTSWKYSRCRADVDDAFNRPLRLLVDLNVMMDRRLPRGAAAGDVIASVGKESSEALGEALYEAAQSFGCFEGESDLAPPAGASRIESPAVVVGSSNSIKMPPAAATAPGEKQAEQGATSAH